MRVRLWIGIASVFVTTSTTRAQFVVSSFSTHTENFELYTGSGFSPTPTSGELDSTAWIVQGLIPADLEFGDTATSGRYAMGQSAGGESNAGVYSFDVSNGGPQDRSVGIQPDDLDFTPGAFYLKVQNQTGASWSSMQVSYDLAVFNDQNRANSFNWGFAVSGSNLTDPSGLSYTLLAGYTSPETADPDPVSWTKQTLFMDQPVNVPNGQFVYFQWFGDDVSGAGNWDQFAIAQFSITPVPEPSLMLLAGVPILAAWRLRRNRGKSASREIA